METQQVNSADVSVEMLESWGIAVQVTDKVCGAKVVVREGASFGAAVFEAWARGFVRMGGHRCQRQERRDWTFDQEMFDFLTR